MTSWDFVPGNIETLGKTKLTISRGSTRTLSVYYSTETDCLLRKIRKDSREIFNHLLCRKKKCCSTVALSERV